MNVRSCLALAFAGAVAACSNAPRDDADFAAKAAQGGYAEVDLGQLAVRNGQSASVKSFAQQMVNDHTQANQELAAVAAKANIQVPNAASQKQKDAADDLSRKQGGDFDKAYAKLMKSDHEDTVELFRKEAESGGNADLKAFAQRTLPTLEHHLQMAKDLENSATASASP